MATTQVSNDAQFDALINMLLALATERHLKIMKDFPNIITHRMNILLITHILTKKDIIKLIILKILQKMM